MSENTSESDREEESSNRNGWDTPRRDFLKATGAGAGALTFGTATTMSGAADSHITVTVDLSSTDIESGEAVEATVSISEIPNGLSGLLGDAMVSDSSVAQITGVSFPDGWGLTQDPEISSDGSSVNLTTADINGNFEEGATDVELFTLELEGQSAGEVSIDLEDLVENADGEFYSFELESPTVTVDGGTGEGENGEGENGEGENGEGEGDGGVTVSVDLSSDSIDAGETAEATISISEIPSGLSGLLGDAMVSDSSVAQITGVSFPDGWGLTQDPEISSDGSSVNLTTADIDGNYSAGDTNVELVTLELEGQSAGEVSIELEDLVEDGDGNFYDFALSSPTLSVAGGTGEGENGEGENGEGENGEGENGEGEGDGDVTVSIDLSSDSIDAGETAEATVTISEIPSGLSGLLGDAMVSDSSVAQITDVSFPDGWGLTQDPEISSDGSSVNLTTADIDGNYSAGDTNVELVTLVLEGQSAGEVSIELEDLVEDGDGNFYDFTLDSPTLSVDGGTGEGENGEGEGDGDVTVSIDLSSNSIQSGETAEATLTISEIPNGLSGLLGDAMVTNADAAQFTGASFPDDWGLAQDPEISSDGSSINLTTADIDGNYSAGDTDVELVTLELEGVGAGDTEIDLENLVEDADGNFYDLGIDSETLSVDGGGTGPGPEGVTVSVDFSQNDIESGDTTEATVTISEIPDGLSGLLGDAMVTNADAAEFTGASFPDDWGLTQEPEISSDGSSINLTTADIDGNYSAGDTDVELVTLELEGVGEGDTEIDLEDLVEDADGNFYDFDLESETLSVDGGGTGPGPGDVIVSVDFSANDIESGDTTEATVSISEIPNGLSGVLGDAMVTDSSVAEITGASFPDGWGLTQDPEISSDGSSVNLTTADIDGNYSAGDTDVELFTIELEGVGDGDTEIDLEDLVEDADGNFYDFDLESETLSVEGDGTGPGPGDVIVSVDFSQNDIESGDTTEATVTISEIPDGLSGLLGDAMVTNPDAAEFTGASFPSDWGLTQEPEISSDGSSINLTTADIDGNYSAGDTDVELVTLELEGVGDGDTEIDLEDLVEDADGNFYDFDLESETLSVEGDGTGPGPEPEPDPDALVVDDFESSGGSNDLGRWRGGGSFQNGGGEVSGGELVLDYDGAGWYASQVDEDLSDYSELVLAVRGDSGGEESDFTVSLGGAQTLAANVADGSISTSTSDLRIDLDALGANRSSPGQLNLNFWQGGSSTIYIDQIRFE